MRDDRIDPLEKLAAAHRRIEENLNDLARAAQTLNGSRSREEGLEMVSSVIAYFERTVTRHEEDEERSLFSRLAVLEPIAPTIVRLREEHEAHRRAVDELRAVIARDSGAGAAEALLPLITALRALYDRHIACEEQEIFPAARRFLRPAAMQSIATEMESRHGRAAAPIGVRPASGRPPRPGGTRRGP